MAFRLNEQQDELVDWPPIFREGLFYRQVGFDEINEFIQMASEEGGVHFHGVGLTEDALWVNNLLPFNIRNTRYVSKYMMLIALLNYLQQRICDVNAARHHAMNDGDAELAIQFDNTRGMLVGNKNTVAHVLQSHISRDGHSRGQDQQANYLRPGEVPLFPVADPVGEPEEQYEVLRARRPRETDNEEEEQPRQRRREEPIDLTMDTSSDEEDGYETDKTEILDYMA